MSVEYHQPGQSPFCSWERCGHAPTSGPTCPHHDAPLVCGVPGCGLGLWNSIETGMPAHWRRDHEPVRAHRLPPVCGVCGEPERIVGRAHHDVRHSHRFQPTERVVECTA